MDLQGQIFLSLAFFLFVHFLVDVDDEALAVTQTREPDVSVLLQFIVCSLLGGLKHPLLVSLCGLLW